MTTQSAINRALAAPEAGRPLSDGEALALAGCTDLPRLTALAEELALAGHGRTISFSKKVFIPLTRLCRDVCHYCTFARAPSKTEPHFLAPDAVLDIARAGAAAGCKEALFTLGDQPEDRYTAAREALTALGATSTLEYLEASAGLVLRETGLLPHLNPGVMDEAWLRRLKAVSVSQGVMLETAAERLSERGGPHFGSPDKSPAVRLATLDAAGRAGVPFTTGILIGIGETRVERIESLLAIRDLHDRYGHIQEVIIQNFRAKSGTRMAGASEPSLDDHLWTIAVARIVLGAAMNIQAPPNLQPAGLAQLMRAGINDWGGVSPVTPDHVNPEAPWPHLRDLERATEAGGRTLVERLAIYAEFLPDTLRQTESQWLDPALRTPVLRQRDTVGLAREDAWSPGAGDALPAPHVARVRSGSGASRTMLDILGQVGSREPLSEVDIVTLFNARGADFTAVCRAADALRAERVGDVVTYVVNRNINYTNICTYGCKFCAFSKGRHSFASREKPYDLGLEEVAKRTSQAWDRGATEVCLQGGIRPGYTGHTYRAIVEAVKIAAPDIHVHAFSPLEVWHGASTLGQPLRTYLTGLKAAGLGSLPGTAAEILDDEVRAVLCPDKISTEQWLEVMEAAHDVGLKSTATIMFGHIDDYRHWARHLLRIRDLQARTGGFTEFVPLAFVHMEAPIYLRGHARKGPTFREAMLMHAVGRLVLDPYIVRMQASWVKMGPDGAVLCLDAGANDMGGVLMDESITRAAGAVHGQEVRAEHMENMIRQAGRFPLQRTTLYDRPLPKPMPHPEASPLSRLNPP
jgi:FO synthase